MELIKVAIADDNENMIRMLTDLVSRDSELHVVGTAKTVRKPVRLSGKRNPILYFWILSCRSWTGWV